MVILRNVTKNVKQIIIENGCYIYIYFIYFVLFLVQRCVCTCKYSSTETSWIYL